MVQPPAPGLRPAATWSRAGSARPTPFTFDPQMLAAAKVADRAAAGPAAVPARSRWPTPVDPRRPGDDLALSDLVDVLPRPGQGVLPRPRPDPAVGRRRRSATRCPSRSTSWRPGAWATGCSRTCCAASTPTPRARSSGAAVRCRPAMLGWRKATEVRETAMNLAVAALTHRQVEPRRPTTSTSQLRGGRRLTGTVTPGLRRPAGRGRLLQARRQAPARVVGPAAGAGGRPPRPQLDGPDDRAVTARQPGRAAAARAGRATSRSRCSTTWSTSTTRAAARRSQLPLKTSFAWASALRSWARTPSPRRSRSGSRSRFPGEDADPAHVRVWGEHADLDDLTGLPDAGRAALVPAAATARRGPM